MTPPFHSLWPITQKSQDNGAVKKLGLSLRSFVLLADALSPAALTD
jgi:hypothetical protein